MFHLLLARHRMPAAPFFGVVAVHAGENGASGRAVVEPLSGVHVVYERFGREADAGASGRFEASLVTPAGTLRSSVRAVAAGDRHFQRGDTAWTCRCTCSGASCRCVHWKAEALPLAGGRGSIPA